MLRSLALLVLFPAVPVAQQVGMFRGDAAHSGVYAGGGANIVGLQWRVPTAGEVTSSPVVLNGTVYVGSGDGQLRAVERASGRVRWSYDAGSPLQSSPAVARGLVFIAGRDGSYHAVDASTGKRRWRTPARASLPLPWGHESGDKFISSPVVSGSLVIFGSGDGGVYALDQATGTTKWRGATQGRVRGSPAVANGKVYVGSLDGRVYAFDLASGKQLWRYDTEGVTLNSANFGFDRRSVQSSPAVADNTVYVGARDGFLYALDAGTGALRWRFDHKVSWVIGSPALADGMLYVGSSDGQFMQAVDARTGAEKWRANEASTVWSSPAVAGKYLVFGDGAGRLHVADRATGKDLAIFRTGALIHSSPVVDRDRVVFGSADGNVYSLRVSDSVAVRRAVFFDSVYAPTGTIANAADISRYMANRGYEVLNAAALASFLEARIADRAPSVILFAIDALPPAIPLRRYLDSGGKVVWSGLPPAIWPVEPGKTRAGLNEVHWDAPTQLLGVSHALAMFDQRTARATPTGAAWGLPATLRTAWSVEPGAVTTVLALDDWGLAAAWVKHYGGAEGTGFVRVASDDLLAMYLAAEYRPVR